MEQSGDRFDVMDIHAVNENELNGKRERIKMNFCEKRIDTA